MTDYDFPFETGEMDHVVRIPRPIPLKNGKTLDLSNVPLAKDHVRFPHHQAAAARRAARDRGEDPKGISAARGRGGGARP